MSISLKQQTFVGVIWSSIERFSVQGIQFILSLIIARELHPSDYGLIAMLTIFMAIANCFVNSGFSSALIQKQNRTNIDYSTVFYFNIVVGIIMYIILLISAPTIASFYKQPILKEIITWVGLNIIISSFSTVQNAILAINLNFRKLTIISLTSVTISGVIAIYMAFNNYGVWTLVVQGLLNGCINVILLWINTKWHPQFVFSKSSFNELFSFGSKLLISSLLHTIYTNLYTLIIGKVYQPQELGLYSKACSLSQYPSTNITGILNRVLFPVLCRIQNNNDALTDKFYLSIRMTAFIVFPLMIGLAAISEPFIRLVLTDKWISIVPFLQILCFAYMWDPIMNMTANLLNVKHRSDYTLKAEIIKKLLAIVILFTTLPFGIKVMCWGLLFYSLLDIVIISLFIQKVLPHVKLKNHLKNLFPPFLQSIIMGSIIITIIQLFTSIWVQFFSGIISGVIIYITLSPIICKNEIDFIFQLFKRNN